MMPRTQKQQSSAGSVVLDLSGPKLRAALSDLIDAAEPSGGIERYISDLQLKVTLFRKLLVENNVLALDPAAFSALIGFIATVRRRIKAALENYGLDRLLCAIERLLKGEGTAAERLRQFTAAFPNDRGHRWVRDLGAELLHFTDPQNLPLATRWVWDVQTNTGVLREIWHADDVDNLHIPVSDDFETFEILREELTGFLRGEGFFRDLGLYVDLLCAHIYALYINDRAGQYLRTDFGRNEAPMAHTRRMLGLDAIEREPARSWLALIEESAAQAAQELARPGA